MCVYFKVYYFKIFLLFNFPMKFKFDRENVIKAIIIVIILTFFFSMFAVGMNGNNDTPENEQEDIVEPQLLVGQGKIELILKEYSGEIELERITNESRDFIIEGVTNGDVLYFNEEANKVSIVLSDKTKTYDYLSVLIANDPEVFFSLKARVYNTKKFDFYTDDGQTISSNVPESEIYVYYPYNIGEVLEYTALVQILDGTIVGAQLYPIPKEEQVITQEVNMLFNVNEIQNEYNVMLFFNWHDREVARTLSSNLNDSLHLSNGVDEVQTIYTSDITIYMSRALYSEEADALKERFPDIKTINMEKIVFYDNSTETEEVISNYLYNLTNGTVTLSFSPSLLQLSFKYNGTFNEIEPLLGDLEELSIKKLYLQKAVISTDSISLKIGNSTYTMNEQKVLGLIPVNHKNNDIITLLVSATIKGTEIVGIEQVLDLGFE